MPCPSKFPRNFEPNQKNLEIIESIFETRKKEIWSGQKKMEPIEGWGISVIQFEL